MMFFNKNHAVIISALLAASSASADGLGKLNPYLGADYYQSWMRGQNDWKRVFPRSYRGATLYVGTKFCNELGVEFGYDRTTRTKKDWALSGTSAFFSGSVAPTGISGATKATQTSVHLDLLGFLPVADCFDLFASVGLGWVQNKIDITLSTASGSNQSTALASVSGKGRSVLRAGVGGSYMMNEMVGLRAKLGWESTSRLRIKGNQAFTNLGYQSKGWKDATALSIGAFVKF